jgi:hypothetical protein
MQVSVAFVESHAAAKLYPYPVTTNLPHEVFTRRGGVYFGVEPGSTELALRALARRLAMDDEAIRRDLERAKLHESNASAACGSRRGCRPATCARHAGRLSCYGASLTRCADVGGAARRGKIPLSFRRL